LKFPRWHILAKWFWPVHQIIKQHLPTITANIFLPKQQRKPQAGESNGFRGELSNAWASISPSLVPIKVWPDLIMPHFLIVPKIKSSPDTLLARDFCSGSSSALSTCFRVGCWTELFNSQHYFNPKMFKIINISVYPYQFFTQLVQSCISIRLTCVLNILLQVAFRNGRRSIETAPELCQGCAPQVLIPIGLFVLEISRCMSPSEYKPKVSTCGSR
jgi:hypothetical protein